MTGVTFAVVITKDEKVCTRTQGIRLPHKASSVPWIASDLFLSFCPINKLRLLGEAIAELPQRGTQSIEAGPFTSRRCGGTHPLGPGAGAYYIPCNC
jgi:hypothetical protein